MDTYGVNDLLEALDIEAEIENNIEKNRHPQEPSSTVPLQDLSDEQIENLKRFAERENEQ